MHSAAHTFLPRSADSISTSGTSFGPAPIGGSPRVCGAPPRPAGAGGCCGFCGEACAPSTAAVAANATAELRSAARENRAFGMPRIIFQVAAIAEDSRRPPSVSDSRCDVARPDGFQHKAHEGHDEHEDKLV